MQGRRWRSWKDWTAGCRFGMKGGILAAQEARPSPVFLRNGHGRSANVAVPTSGVDGLGEHWIETLEPLHSRAED